MDAAWHNAQARTIKALGTHHGRQGGFGMKCETIRGIIDVLQAGETPELPLDEFTCFSAEATEGNPNLGPHTAQEIAACLSGADIPTLRRALQAMARGELAWLGFKVVYDADQAMSNTDNEVTRKYGDVGSADGDPLLFFCNDAKEIVASRELSARDCFQAKDVTRGPSMHTEQFPGLNWASVPLFGSVRVWLLGASDSAAEVAALAHHVGFEVVAVDEDTAYLNEERFPMAHRVLLDSFDDMSGIHADPSDYACVLTRGHTYDPQACVWAANHDVHYVGMMGCAGKNESVYAACKRRGMTDAQWERIKRPIGFKFGAKTPAELAIAIVAELVDVRYRQRYSAEARARHDANLGR